MKSIVLSYISILIGSSVLAQTQFPIDSVSGKIRYEKIVSVEETSKAELFERANVWLAQAFVDSKEVIQYSIQETGKVLAKGLVQLNAVYNGYEQSMGATRFTLEINTKDNRIRIIVTDLRHEFSDGSASPEDLRKEKSRPIMKGAWRVIKSETDEEIKGLISSFESAVTEVKKDDW